MRRFIFVFLSVLFVILFTLFLYLYSRILVSTHPDIPYLSSVYEKYPDVDWDSAYFQPVYLFGSTKDDQYFLKTAFRDAKGKLKFVDIFVGGKYGGRTYNLAKTDAKDPGTESFSEYKSQFKFGQRISVAYFFSLTFSDGWRDTDLCKANKDLCDLTESVFKEEGDRMKEFPLTGDIKGKQTITALFVSSKLNTE